MTNKNNVAASKSTKLRVLECIQNHAPINRSAISKAVGISIPAVMTITEELLQNEIIESVGFAKSGVGKHPELLSVRGDTYHYIGIDVGRVHLRSVLTGQNGKTITSLRRHTEHGEDPAQTISDICDLIHDTITASEINAETLVGICVAMPGLIESDTGKVLFSPNFGWKNVPLQDLLREKLHPHQVIVRNANRAQARFHIQSESFQDVNSVICVGLGYGIGSGIINNGIPYNGASGTSGEIGHITILPNGPVCSCGNSGCLESLASGYAIGLQGRQLAEHNPDSILLKLADGNIDQIDAKTVFDAAALRDLDSMQIIDDAAKYIGIALAATINLQDPDIIYLCGGLVKNHPDFFEKIKMYTRFRQMKFAGKHVKIQPGSKDDFTVAKGATLMIQDSGSTFEKLKFLY